MKLTSFRLAHRWLLAPLVGGVLSSTLLVASCSDKREEAKCRKYTTLVEPANALSEELMVALGQAKNFHGKADVLLDENKPEEAAEAIRSIFDLAFPVNAPEAEEVILDARARLAELYMQQERYDEAQEVLDDGITSSRHRSFFLANVHAMRGKVLHAQAKLETDSEKADALRRQAIDAFDASTRINQTLLDNLSQAEETPHDEHDDL